MPRQKSVKASLRDPESLKEAFTDLRRETPRHSRPPPGPAVRAPRRAPVPSTCRAPLPLR
ncbi:hypothetical protein DL991_27920 [Amycolatopsis sp. WAC 01375]|nr:hypothetical protein DL991_27920 [Amycolatopsis sp. WAC 01375]